LKEFLDLCTYETQAFKGEYQFERKHYYQQIIFDGADSVIHLHEILRLEFFVIQN